jgi:hypothetical protein
MLLVTSALLLVAAAQVASPPEPPMPPPEPVVAVPVEAEPEPAQLFRDASNDAFGDATVSGFSLRTLIQMRYGHTMPRDSASGDERATVRDDDGWRLNRAFLRLVAAPNKRMQGRITVDFAELMKKNPRRALKSAYGQFTPWKWLELTAGVFKRTFSLMELLPMADFELTQEGPTNDLAKDMGYAGRDAGAMIRVTPLAKKRWLSLWLAAFSGDLEEGYDAAPGKLLTGRIESRPLPYLRLGADLAWRTSESVGHEKYPSYLEESLVLEKGRAYSADATFALAGFELRLEGLFGRRTDVQWTESTRPTDFLAGWAIATYRFPVATAVVMPVVRAEWLDVSRGQPGGRRYFLTAGLNVEVNANVRLLVDVSRYEVQAGSQALKDRPWPTPASGPDYDVRVKDVDWWQLIAQLQLKI